MSDTNGDGTTPSTPLYDQAAETGSPLGEAGAYRDVESSLERPLSDTDVDGVPRAAGGASSSDGTTVGSTGTYGTVGGSTTGTYGSTGSSGGGKADAAKGEAGKVAGDAKEQAANVAGSAKEQAGKVASEAADHAKQLFGQSTSELKDQAGAQQEKAAAGLRTVGQQLESMAQGSDSGVAQQLVSNLSGRAHGVAEWLEGRDPGSLLDDVKHFAARKPGTFIAIAAVSGLLAGRVVKSLTAEAKDEHEAASSTGTSTAGASTTGAAHTTGTSATGPIAGEYDVVTEGGVPGLGATGTSTSSVPGTWPDSTGARP
jgi:cell division septum initiation protein DivIVA